MTITTVATAAARDNSTWLKWFSSIPSTSIINQSQQERLFKTFDATVSNDTILDIVIQHKETTFLQKVNFAASRVTIFHHLVASGGTIYDSSTKEFGFMQGLLKGGTSMKMTPDEEILSRVEKDTDTPVPAIANVLGVQDSDAVDGLAVSATVKFRPRNFIPIPPFLLDTIHSTIELEKGDTKAVLINVAKKVKEFDTENAGKEEYKDKAKSKCKDMLYWLYLVAVNSDAIRAENTIGCSNDGVLTELNAIDKVIAQETPNVPVQHLSNQLEASLKRPFEVLAATTSSTTDFMEKLTQLQNQTAEKASKTFKKIPAKYQQMILVAASQSEVTEIDYDADAAEFFKCSTPLDAQVMLNSLFETENIECSVCPAVATTLLYGSFFVEKSTFPSRVSSISTYLGGHHEK